MWKLTATFENCVGPNGTKWNGTIEYLIEKDDNDTKTASQTMLSDFNFTGINGHSLDLQEGSQWHFTRHADLNYTKVTKSYVITIDKTRTLGASNWVQHRVLNPQTRLWDKQWYPVSGRIYFDNMRHYLDIDSSYDASQTPFRLNDTNDLASGRARYTGDGGRGVDINILTVGTAELYFDLTKDGNYTVGPVTVNY